MGKNPAQKAKQAEKKADDKVVSSRAKAPKKAKKKIEVAAKEKSCKIASCKREYRAKGYCRVHYKKWRQGEYGKARFKPCKEHECRKPIGKGRFGFCEDHYQAYYVKGVERAAAPEPAKAPAAAPAAASA